MVLPNNLPDSGNNGEQQDNGGEQPERSKKPENRPNPQNGSNVNNGTNGTGVSNCNNGTDVNVVNAVAGPSSSSNSSSSVARLYGANGRSISLEEVHQMSAGSSPVPPLVAPPLPNRKLSIDDVLRANHAMKMRNRPPESPPSPPLEGLAARLHNPASPPPQPPRPLEGLAARLHAATGLTSPAREEPVDKAKTARSFFSAVDQVARQAAIPTSPYPNPPLRHDDNMASLHLHHPPEEPERPESRGSNEPLPPEYAQAQLKPGRRRKPVSPVKAVARASNVSNASTTEKQQQPAEEDEEQPVPRGPDLPSLRVVGPIGRPEETGVCIEQVLYEVHREEDPYNVDNVLRRAHENDAAAAIANDEVDTIKVGQSAGTENPLASPPVAHAQINDRRRKQKEPFKLERPPPPGPHQMLTPRFAPDPSSEPTPSARMSPIPPMAIASTSSAATLSIVRTPVGENLSVSKRRATGASAPPVPDEVTIEIIKTPPKADKRKTPSKSSKNDNGQGNF